MIATKGDRMGERRKIIAKCHAKCYVAKLVGLQWRIYYVGSDFAGSCAGLLVFTHLYCMLYWLGTV